MKYFQRALTGCALLMTCAATTVAQPGTKGGLVPASSRAPCSGNAFPASDWLQGRMEIGADITLADSASQKAASMWCGYLEGGRYTIGGSSTWEIHEPRVAGGKDLAHRLLLNEPGLATRVRAVIHSVTSARNDSGFNVTIRTRFDTAGSKGLRVLVAETEVLAHVRGDSIKFESAIVPALRTSKPVKLGNIIYAMVKGAVFDSARAAHGQAWMKDLEKRFTLTGLNPEPEWMYVVAPNELGLKRTLGFIYFADTLSGFTSQSPIMVLSGSADQGEAHFHELVHATLARTEQNELYTPNWEEAFAGFVGGWRGSPWPATVCRTLRQWNKAIADDPATIPIPLATDALQGRMQNALQATLLSVVWNARGDSGLRELMFADANIIGLDTMRNREAKKMDVSTAEFNARWKAALDNSRSSCVKP